MKRSEILHEQVSRLKELASTIEVSITHVNALARIGLVFPGFVRTNLVTVHAMALEQLHLLEREAAADAL